MGAKETTTGTGGDLEKQLLEYLSIYTGNVSIFVEHGQEVSFGDILYSIERNGLTAFIKADKDGVISDISYDCDGHFVGFDVHLLTLEHCLTEQEKEILREEMEYTFICAEKAATYYLTPEREAPPLIHIGDVIHDGDILAVSMVMKNKREVIYHGPIAEIRKIYFRNEEQRKSGERLLGVVPLNQT